MLHSWGGNEPNYTWRKAVPVRYSWGHNSSKVPEPVQRSRSPELQGGKVVVGVGGIQAFISWTSKTGLGFWPSGKQNASKVTEHYLDLMKICTTASKTLVPTMCGTSCITSYNFLGNPQADTTPCLHQESLNVVNWSCNENIKRLDAHLYILKATGNIHVVWTEDQRMILHVKMLHRQDSKFIPQLQGFYRSSLKQSLHL